MSSYGEFAAAALESHDDTSAAAAAYGAMAVSDDMLSASSIAASSHAYARFGDSYGALGVYGALVDDALPEDGRIVKPADAYMSMNDTAGAAGAQQQQTPPSYTAAAATGAPYAAFSSDATSASTSSAGAPAAHAAHVAQQQQQQQQQQQPRWRPQLPERNFYSLLSSMSSASEDGHGPRLQQRGQLAARAADATLPWARAGADEARAGAEEALRDVQQQHSAGGAYASMSSGDGSTAWQGGRDGAAHASSAPPASGVAPRAAPTSPSRDWNGEFQEIVEAWQRGERTHATVRRMRCFLADFRTAAERLVRMIVQDSTVDGADGGYRVPQADVGGLAGGEKFIHDGLFIKLLRDSHQIYGTDQRAARVGCLEVQGLGALRDCEVPGLSCPLMIDVEFRGFRLLVSPVLPLRKTTLVYGSADGGKTVLTDPMFGALMAQACSKLHLAPHPVGPTGSQIIFGPCDIEGHNGVDGRRYVLDAARVFPPEAPRVTFPLLFVPVLPTATDTAMPARTRRDHILAYMRVHRKSWKMSVVHLLFGELPDGAMRSPDEWENTFNTLSTLSRGDLTLLFRTDDAVRSLPDNRVANYFAYHRPEANADEHSVRGPCVLVVRTQADHLCRMLRPELVAAGPPLSSDAFTFFGRHSAAVYNVPVLERTTELIQNIVPQFAKDLASGAASPVTVGELHDELHRRGINMRLLGLVMTSMKEHGRAAHARTLVMTAMISRVVKQIVRERLQAVRSRNDADCLPSLCTVLNEVFGRSTEAMNMWTYDVRLRIVAKFGAYCAPLSRYELSLATNLRSIVLVTELFAVIAEAVGMRVTPSMLDKFAHPERLFVAQPFSERDFVPDEPLHCVFGPAPFLPAGVRELWRQAGLPDDVPKVTWTPLDHAAIREAAKALPGSKDLSALDTFEREWEAQRGADAAPSRSFRAPTSWANDARDDAVDRAIALEESVRVALGGKSVARAMALVALAAALGDDARRKTAAGEARAGTVLLRQAVRVYERARFIFQRLAERGASQRLSVYHAVACALCARAYDASGDVEKTSERLMEAFRLLEASTGSSSAASSGAMMIDYDDAADITEFQTKIHSQEYRKAFKALGASARATPGIESTSATYCDSQLEKYGDYAMRQHFGTMTSRGHPLGLVLANWTSDALQRADKPHFHYDTVVQSSWMAFQMPPDSIVLAEQFGEFPPAGFVHVMAASYAQLSTEEHRAKATDLIRHMSTTMARSASGLAHAWQRQCLAFVNCCERARLMHLCLPEWVSLSEVTADDASAGAGGGVGGGAGVASGAAAAAASAAAADESDDGSDIGAETLGSRGSAWVGNDEDDVLASTKTERARADGAAAEAALDAASNGVADLRRGLEALKVPLFLDDAGLTVNDDGTFGRTSGAGAFEQLGIDTVTETHRALQRALAAGAVREGSVAEFACLRAPPCVVCGAPPCMHTAHGFAHLPPGSTSTIAVATVMTSVSGQRRHPILSQRRFLGIDESTHEGRVVMINNGHESPWNKSLLEGQYVPGAVPRGVERIVCGTASGLVAFECEVWHSVTEQAIGPTTMKMERTDWLPRGAAMPLRIVSHVTGASVAMNSVTEMRAVALDEWTTTPAGRFPCARMIGGTNAGGSTTHSETWMTPHVPGFTAFSWTLRHMVAMVMENCTVLVKAE